MNDFYLPFIILTLIAVIIIQAVEKHTAVSRLLAEQSKLLAAVMSKNIGEYNAAVRVEKETKVPDPLGSDETTLENASDEEFDKFIDNQVK